MEEFTAELERAFGTAPSRTTGLMIDTVDSAGLGGARTAAFSTATYSVSPCRRCGVTRVADQA